MSNVKYILQVLLCVTGILGLIAFVLYSLLSISANNSTQKEYEALEQEWKTTKQDDISIFGFILGNELKPSLQARVSPREGHEPYRIEMNKDKTNYTLSNFMADCHPDSANNIYAKNFKCFKILKDDGSAYQTNDIERLILTTEPSGSLIEIHIMFNETKDMENFKKSLLNKYSKSLVSKRALHKNFLEDSDIIRLKNDLVAIIKQDGRSLYISIPEEGYINTESINDESFITASWKGWSETQRYKDFMKKQRIKENEQNKEKQESYSDAFS